MENHTLGEEMSNKNWISEFDKLFCGKYIHNGTIGHYLKDDFFADDIKKFIKSQIKQAEEREREKYKKHLETKLVYLEDLEKQHQEQFDIDYSRYNITKSEKDKKIMLEHEGSNSAYRGGVLSGKIEEVKELITLINQNNENTKI
jgi:hypothetical protein